MCVLVIYIQGVHADTVHYCKRLTVSVCNVAWLSLCECPSCVVSLLTVCHQGHAGDNGSFVSWEKVLSKERMTCHHQFECTRHVCVYVSVCVDSILLLGMVTGGRSSPDRKTMLLM